MTPGPVPASSLDDLFLSPEPIIEGLSVDFSSLYVNFVSAQSNAIFQTCIPVLARNSVHQSPLNLPRLPAVLTCPGGASIHKTLYPAALTLPEEVPGAAKFVSNARPIKGAKRNSLKHF
jgi:hypothetical protein